MKEGGAAAETRPRRDDALQAALEGAAPETRQRRNGVRGRCSVGAEGQNRGESPGMPIDLFRSSAFRLSKSTRSAAPPRTEEKRRACGRRAVFAEVPNRGGVDALLRV